jgi:CDP-diacylglycerol--glycerol-3-phosphate 3-phosphatidyltransferase
MKSMPLLLIYLRLVFAFVIVALSLFKPAGISAYIITLIVLGLISDVFDGIIARKLNVSTEKLRRMDSGIDQIFWLCIVAASFIMHPKFYMNNWLQIVVLIAAEGLCYLISFIKFRKEVATHAIASKIWTLVLFATLIQIIAIGKSVVLFQFCFYLGMVTRLEIIIILLLIKQWTNDIPTVYHAYLIRNNKPIKRHRLFNG